MFHPFQKKQVLSLTAMLLVVTGPPELSGRRQRPPIPDPIAV
jgi:hypothetical protein